MGDGDDVRVWGMEVVLDFHMYKVTLRSAADMGGFLSPVPHQWVSFAPKNQ